MLADFFGIIGTTLAGAFRVEEVIAEGGYAVVYRAEHVAFRAPVALKCLKLPTSLSADQSQSFVENFREEAEILFHLSASIPEVVRPLHADAITLEDGTFVPYLAMEWIDGKPLDSIVILRERDGRPPLGVHELLDMLTPIAHALSRAHRFEVPGGRVVEVTHCDLKPENIVITENDQPVRAKILDFGIAKARDLLAGQYGGLDDERRPFTPNYGAPEQWAPRQYGQTGPWTDVWGFALTLVECLTGKPVLEGDLRGMMDKVLDETVRPTPRNEGIELSDELEEVFDRALAVDPRDRYDSIEAFWSALERAAGAPGSFDRPSVEGRRLRPGEGPSSRRLEAELPTTDFELDHPFDEVERPADDHVLDDADGEFDSGEYVVEPEVDGLAFTPPISAPQAADLADPLEDSGVRRQLEFDLSEMDEGSGDGPRSSPRLAPTDTAPISLAARTTRGGPGANADAPSPRRVPTELVQELARSGAKREVRGIGARLIGPGIVLAVAFLLTFVDMFTAGRTGGFLMLGPIRVRWIAGLCALGGIGWAIWNVVVERQGE